MDLLTVLDITNIILIILGLLTIFMTGFMSKFIKMNTSFNFSVVSIFTGGFLIANYITTINQMRVVVISLFLFVIIPWIITYLMIWMYPRETTILRTKMSTLVGWFLGLTILSGIRLLFGWGFTVTSTIVIIGILLSVLNGLLGGIIGNYLIYKIEQINPSQ